MAFSKAEALMRLGMPADLAKQLQDWIEDGGSGDVSADQVSFDPSSAPGVTASDVQGAIEELAGIIDGL